MKTLIQLTDDIDGTELGDGEGETVTFSLDGTSYEMDLSNKNAEELRNRLSEFTGHARKVSNGRRSSNTRKASPSTDGASAAEIRAWAKDNGHDVPERGRIPADVREAFEAAN